MKAPGAAGMSLQATATFFHAATGGSLGWFQVDAGAASGLPDALARAWFDQSPRDFVITPSYDPMHRVLAIGVVLRGTDESMVAARAGYGESLALAEAQARNLRGRAMEGFAQDGWTAVQGVSLLGQSCAAIRYLTRNYQGTVNGMPAESIPPLTGSKPDDAGLQQQGYSGTVQRHDALGRSLEAVNLQGNVLCTSYLQSGLPNRLSADGVVYLSAFTCNAKAQLLSVVKGGSGGDAAGLFATLFRYDARSYRVVQRYASSSAAFVASLPASGTQWIDGGSDAGRRQDIRYAFDPNGNVLALQDAYPAIVFGEGRMALVDYRYDALNRMLNASGMESAAASPTESTPGYGAAATAVGSDAGAQLLPYRQYYEYDDGGNITALAHFSNGSLSASRSTAMKVSGGSNRCISARYYESLGGSGNGTYIDESFFSDQGLFDSAGNTLKNASLVGLNWDYRNQATCIHYPAPDNSNATVIEYSVHGAGGGARSRKVVETRNAQGVLIRLDTVAYFGGVEQRASYEQADDAGIVYDGETVGNAKQLAGYSELRLLLGHAQQVRVQAGVLEPGGASVTQVWYSLGDHLDSCQLELDGEGTVCSYQSFYPYGATAFSAAAGAKGDANLAQKVRQYSGEEKDGSGLSYYGFRSYDPANFRWINPDPAGLRGSGLNLYRMVDGNPVTFRDRLGLTKETRTYRSRHNYKIDVEVGDREEFRQFRSQYGLDRASVQWVLAENHGLRDVTRAAISSLRNAGCLRPGLTVNLEEWISPRERIAAEELDRTYFGNCVSQHASFKDFTLQSAEPLGRFLQVQRSVHSSSTFGDLIMEYVGTPRLRNHNFAALAQDAATYHAWRTSIRFMGDSISETATKCQLENQSALSVVGALHLFPMPAGLPRFEHDPDDFDLLRRLAGEGHITLGIVPLPVILNEPDPQQLLGPMWRYSRVAAFELDDNTTCFVLLPKNAAALRHNFHFPPLIAGQARRGESERNIEKQERAHDISWQDAGWVFPCSIL
ncbi:MAG TPA: RHS repeat-associated core domain-containing protein [Noviherbaspirillum sp.]|uniref:RHS repeat-associated core domain-containing protein n=1 Tax=Noviherbaspirillum sp. TaxID=1926288 RepID=UPI002D3223EF|nr:RHS repeat-associated core domain-containing protein [Noviherbaspirillum sp.]HYD97610.1 RHS repeat-associated core domain-containing protein [Noviherbaspirillum sp.]